MSVEFALVETPFPYVCAVYRCICGAAVTQHGDAAGTPPPGWETSQGGHNVRCPGCTGKAAGASTLTPPRPPAPS
ncbi:MAG: hypothetical protein QOF68_3138 [Gaiellales bacterium]|jgi:DNA-directed RNA polymerase subunit RPC12/RpoP|nr:hypothetical protein [Gaiellales bacterium]